MKYNFKINKGIMRLKKQVRKKFKKYGKIVAFYILTIFLGAIAGVITTLFTHSCLVEENRLLREWIANRHGIDWQERLTDWSKGIAKQNLTRRGKISSFF